MYKQRLKNAFFIDHWSWEKKVINRGLKVALQVVIFISLLFLFYVFYLIF
jgi:hypothetical protein